MAQADITLNFATVTDIAQGTDGKSIHASNLKQALTASGLAFGYGLSNIYALSANFVDTKLSTISANACNTINLSSESITCNNVIASSLSSNTIVTSALFASNSKFSNFVSNYVNCSAGNMQSYVLKDTYNQTIPPGYFTTNTAGSERLLGQISYTASASAKYLHFDVDIYNVNCSSGNEGYFIIYESDSNLGSYGSTVPVGATAISSRKAYQKSTGGGSAYGVGQKLNLQFYYLIPGNKRNTLRYYGVYGYQAAGGYGCANPNATLYTEYIVIEELRNLVTP